MAGKNEDCVEDEEECGGFRRLSYGGREKFTGSPGGHHRPHTHAFSIHASSVSYSLLVLSPSLYIYLHLSQLHYHVKFTIM